MTSLQRLSWSLCGILLLGCSQPPGPEAAKTAEVAKPAKPAEPAKTGGPPPEASTPARLGRALDQVPLPLSALLDQPVTAVEANLGEHQGKGMARSTCVRFVPERVFFSCSFAVQRYADRGDDWRGIQVEYEDGLAASINFDGYKKGSGPVDPQQLLKAVGLELPDEPRVDSPAEGVRRWAWFNDRARLRIGEHQYRVEVSTVGDDWSRSRVDVIRNDPLTEAQKAKVVAPAGPPAP